jgi:hypothetical protein
MSQAKTGDKHPMFGKTGENAPNFGKTLSEKTKAKMSIAKSYNNPMSKKVFVYSFMLGTKVTILDKSFNTCAEAAKYFNCSILLFLII